MVGKFHETKFDLENYDEFYENHQFVPIPEKYAYTINEVIPRFGWGYDQVKKLNPKRLLDLGCLDGSFTLTVANNIPGCEVVGVDLTKDGIEIARTRALAKMLPAEYIQGKIETVLQTLPDYSFDVVTFFEVIEHVEDVQKVLRLIDRVLKPGGSVLVSTPDFESPLYGKDDEKNKCHIRLYTTEKEDYTATNKYGNVRKATSIWKEIGEDRIKSIGVHNELINVLYQ